MRYAEWHFVYKAPQTPSQSVLPPAEVAKMLPFSASKLPGGQTPPVIPAAQKPFNESLCETQLTSEMAVCQSNASQLGEEPVKHCTESAEARFAECREKQTVIGLTPLKIQPDPENVLPQP